MSPSFHTAGLHKDRLFMPPAAFSSHAHLKNLSEYKKLYDRSTQDPEGFWGDLAQDFFWFEPAQKVFQFDWKERVETQWFSGAKTNLCVNAVDRHLEKRAHQVAILWEGNEPGETQSLTYQELHQRVCQLANTLKHCGIKKGDRVAIYLGMVPEIAISVLACARIGAIHNVIFGGFSAESLRDRILDCSASMLITADGLFRGTKTVPLKEMADEAMDQCEKASNPIRTCLVLKRTGEKTSFNPKRDLWWHEVVPHQPITCEAEVMDAEDPLFILYTSGSTGKPKGVVHTTAGYMVYVATTFRYVFDYQEGDLFWCTADAGWVTGHSYGIYGPLLNGATTLLFEGVPNYPNPDRCWDMIDRHQVNIFYTAPTALRGLMREGDAWIESYSLESLRLLGSVGEPINPEVWIWYHEKIGKGRCPIVDTWWQTETGGILISPLPGAMPLKPGSAALPFFGVQPQVIRDDGEECGPNEVGSLVIKAPWPAILRTVYGQPHRVKETYFSKFPGYYFTGDEAYRDDDGYFWLMGRMDDVLKVSGHRLGTAELESALVSHPHVAEAAVVGVPHPIKGEGIYAFVTLKTEIQITVETEHELAQHLIRTIGPIAKPEALQLSPALPKTRSGKIMRRILRKIAAGQTEELGDISTLADPSVVENLVKSARRF